MSKKRSLGSSPIGFKSDDSSMGFIPDLGVSKAKKDNNGTSSSSKEKVVEKNGQQKEKQDSEEKKKSKKKIVSYNLEVALIDRVKSIAREKDMYYSSLVSLALKNWIAENN